MKTTILLTYVKMKMNKYANNMHKYARPNMIRISKYA